MVCFEFRVTQSDTNLLQGFLLVLTNFKQSVMFFSQIRIVLYQNCILVKLFLHPQSVIIP